MHAPGKLARLGRTLVRACEVADECIGEVDPAIVVAGLQAVQPCPGRALEHERNILHGNALVAVRDADGRGVVDQPVIRLHGAGVLGRVSWEREPFGKGLVLNAGPETRRTQLVFFFYGQGLSKSLDPVALVVLYDSFTGA